MPPRKYSLTINSHRTSVSLEPPFWEAFCAIAEKMRIPRNRLASEIDSARDSDCTLASAIRLYILAHLQSKER